MDKQTKLLIDLGITPDKQGFNYIKLVLAKNNPTALKKSYKQIAAEKGINICTIDSSIRNAIHYAYRDGKLIRLNLVMGCDIISDKRCPTNKELICALYQYMNNSNALNTEISEDTLYN